MEIPYNGPIPDAPIPDAEHCRRRCPALFEGHWQCDLRERHAGPHYSDAWEAAGRPHFSHAQMLLVIEVEAHR